MIAHKRHKASPKKVIEIMLLHVITRVGVVSVGKQTFCAALSLASVMTHKMCNKVCVKLKPKTKLITKKRRRTTFTSSRKIEKKIFQ